MTENWRAWEGRTIDGNFVLQNYLGGSDGSAVFRTRIGTREDFVEAAIRFIPSGRTEAESQLRRWKAASELRHPNLLRILALGHCAVEDEEFLYVVEEFAEENLAQILPERALTPDEARGMLAPVLAALEFAHSRRLAHGQIRPSKIMAARDQVKLSRSEEHTSE